MVNYSVKIVFKGENGRENETETLHFSTEKNAREFYLRQKKSGAVLYSNYLGVNNDSI